MSRTSDCPFHPHSSNLSGVPSNADVATATTDFVSAGVSPVVDLAVPATAEVNHRERIVLTPTSSSGSGSSGISGISSSAASFIPSTSADHLNSESGAHDILNLLRSLRPSSRLESDVAGTFSTRQNGIGGNGELTIEVKGVPVSDVQLRKYCFNVILLGMLQMYVALACACIDAMLGNLFESLLFALGGFCILFGSYYAMTRAREDQERRVACLQSIVSAFLVMHLVRVVSLSWRFMGLFDLEEQAYKPSLNTMNSSEIDNNLRVYLDTSDEMQKPVGVNQVLQLIFSVTLCTMYLGTLLLSIQVVKVQRRIAKHGPILPMPHIRVVSGVPAASLAVVSESSPSSI